MDQELQPQYLYWEEAGLAGDYVHMHIVNVPDHVPGRTYQQLMSLSAFERRLWSHTQSYDPKTGAFLGYRNQGDVHFQMECVENSKPGATQVLDKFQRLWAGNPDMRATLLTLPRTVHPSVWDFYKHIQYDWRTATLRGRKLQQ